MDNPCGGHRGPTAYRADAASISRSGSGARATASPGTAIAAPSSAETLANTGRRATIAVCPPPTRSHPRPANRLAAAEPRARRSRPPRSRDGRAGGSGPKAAARPRWLRAPPPSLPPPPPPAALGPGRADGSGRGPRHAQLSLRAPLPPEGHYRPAQLSLRARRRPRAAKPPSRRLSSRPPDLPSAGAAGARAAAGEGYFFARAALEAC
jgi:hypothetical protein